MKSTAESSKLIDIGRHLSDSLPGKLYPLIEQPLEKVLSVSDLNSIYSSLSSHPQSHDFFSACLDLLQVGIVISDEDMQKVPEKGTLLAVGNHPFGGLDGIILGNLLTRRRKDVKLLGNYLLHMIPELHDSIIPVDPFQAQQSISKNLKPLKETIRFLKQGGALGIFPAGEVSHLQLNRARITDPSWTTHAAALIRHTRATVLPVYFEGRNSNLFHLAGLLHPRFRTAMLPRELTNKKKAEITVRIGSPIPFRHLSRFQSDQHLTDYLRLCTYILKNRAYNGKKRNPGTSLYLSKKGRPEKLIAPVSACRLSRELERLPPEQVLIKQHDSTVYVADSSQIPNALREIGRLREYAFRDVGEGTGKAIDLDRFDHHYKHIVLWNASTEEIVGAYRVGLTDSIMPVYGMRGLYTTTLFKYKGGFLESLSPALELGRSFISPHYQKKHNSLALLWQGIGTYVAQNPRYRILFGPVSISNDYHVVSRNLMLRFLKHTRTDYRMARFVKPRNPARHWQPLGLESRLLCSPCLTVEQVSGLISEIEQDRKGFPVLLRHYLRLNGTILCFNIDKRFSRSIDSLLVVDMLKSDPRLLKRFMGTDGYEAFRRYHEHSASPCEGHCAVLNETDRPPA